jgi:ABC-type amino acid transport substrate-binding protein
MNVRFSAPYLDETLALIVADHRRAEFATWEDIRRGPVRLGLPVVPDYYLAKIRAELPNADVVSFDSPERMFEPRDPPLDALVLTAERGSAYTLRHPQYSVVVPKPRQVKVPLAYAIAGHDPELAAVVNTWIDLKRKDGTIEDLFGHWILGRDAEPKQPRWSILDNVLRRR